MSANQQLSSLRKIKCDQAVPICRRCVSAGRYCERPLASLQFRPRPAEDDPGSAARFPSPDNPQHALQSPRVTTLFVHYVRHLAPWYDLSDSTSAYGTQVPEIALTEPLLFGAVVALAAMHLSRTTAPAYRAAAEFYHQHCVTLLIDLTRTHNPSRLLEQGVALAAACLLRSYEIMDEDIDPNRHLQGAYSLASHPNIPPDNAVFAAGFFNYLREDITFSLFSECPLKIDLEAIPCMAQVSSDHAYLNAVTLILGQIINATFGASASQQKLTTLCSTLRSWRARLPIRFQPVSRAPSQVPQALPSIWMLQDCHAAAMHYDLVCLALLVLHLPEDCMEDLAKCISKCHDPTASREDILDACALEICGVAFTNSSPSVLVNAFGPIAYCGRFIRTRAAQEELIRRLAGHRGSRAASLTSRIWKGSPSSGFDNAEMTWTYKSSLCRVPQEERQLVEPFFGLNRFPLYPNMLPFTPFTLRVLTTSSFLARYAKMTLPSKRLLSTLPAIIRPSREEIQSQMLSARSLEIAVRHVHKDGLVVVEDVIPRDHIDALNGKMVQDALFLQSKGDDGPFNYNLGNLQQDAPPIADYFFPSIFTNPIATQITTGILGPRPKWTFCSANSAMPPLPGALAQRQPVHSDADFAHPACPFALVVNVPLVSMTPANGSTEVWLGTHGSDGFGISAQEGHHGERASGRIRDDLLRERAAVRGPSQPLVPKGSIIIRDLRLWHAGMPNTTPNVRVMLAFIHFSPWYRNRMRLELADDIRPILEDLGRSGRLGLEIPVNWVSREHALATYLDRAFGNSYDFDQEP